MPLCRLRLFQATFDGKSPACGIDRSNRSEKPTHPPAIGTRARS